MWLINRSLDGHIGAHQQQLSKFANRWICRGKGWMGYPRSGRVGAAAAAAAAAADSSSLPVFCCGVTGFSSPSGASVTFDESSASVSVSNTSANHQTPIKSNQLSLIEFTFVNSVMGFQFWLGFQLDFQEDFRLGFRLIIEPHFRQSFWQSFRQSFRRT